MAYAGIGVAAGEAVESMYLQNDFPV